jgi:Uma2 family endonuclease
MARYQAAVVNDEFIGAPDLVVEVLSPSNTAAEMDDKQKLCFANGCREFWMVNEDKKTVRVLLADGPGGWFGVDDIIHSQTLGADIPVSELFEPV